MCLCVCLCPYFVLGLRPISYSTWQDKDMNIVYKSMRSNFVNLDGIWMNIVCKGMKYMLVGGYKKRKKELTSRRFQDPTSWRRVPWLSVSRDEYR